MASVIRRLSSEDAAAFCAIRLESLLAEPYAFGAHIEEEAVQPITFFAEAIVSGQVSGAFEGDELAAVIGLSIPKGRKLRHKGLLWGVTPEALIAIAARSKRRQLASSMRAVASSSTRTSPPD